MEYYLTIKRNKTYYKMDEPENSMLCKRSQTQNTKYNMHHLYKISQSGKSIKTES